MKKTLVILLISLVSLTAYAQDYKDKDYYYYDGIENRSDIGVTADQKRRIIEIKKNIGLRHQSIGRDRSLRGYEKGQAHRKLNQEIRKEIYSILNEGQRSDWDKQVGSSSSSSSTVHAGGYEKWNRKYDSTERKIDALEDEIDDMEDYYDNKIDAVERDYSISKQERKARKEALKAEKKSKKREMKRKKQEMKDSRYY